MKKKKSKLILIIALVLVLSFSPKLFKGEQQNDVPVMNITLTDSELVF